jgi:peptide deformylase
MSVQKISIVPNPILREKSKNVILDNKVLYKKTRQIISDLKGTLRTQKNPRGVGLSAPQIGVSKRIFVLEIERKITTVINPQIISVSEELLTTVLPKEKRFLEGCLSVPGYWGFVDRPNKIEVCFIDQNGEKINKTFEGKESSYFLHEYDHLDGILFVDRILEQKGKIYQIEKDKEGKEELVEIKLT